MSGHFKDIGSCGHTIAQCRCPSPHKPVKRRDELCPDCQRKAWHCPDTIVPEVEAVAKALYEAEGYTRNWRWPPQGSDIGLKYLGLAATAIRVYNEYLRDRL